MNEQDITVTALLLSAACLLAAALQRRGSARRDLRRLLGMGAALGGIALLLLEFAGS